MNFSECAANGPSTLVRVSLVDPLIATLYFLYSIRERIVKSDLCMNANSQNTMNCEFTINITQESTAR